MVSLYNKFNLIKFRENKNFVKFYVSNCTKFFNNIFFFIHNNKFLFEIKIVINKSY